MNSSKPASHSHGYLLLSRTDEWYKELPPAELQRVIADNHAWYERLIAEGKARPGVALARAGAIVSGHKPAIVDGPFAESKEAIGGTLLLDVDTLEEAIAIAETCPSLRYRCTIEIRPICNECPLETWARAQATSVVAVAA